MVFLFVVGHFFLFLGGFDILFSSALRLCLSACILFFYARSSGAVKISRKSYFIGLFVSFLGRYYY